MNENLKNYVCHHPFTYVDVHPNAQWLCCADWAPVNIRGNYSPYNHDNKEKSILTNWHSDLANDVRSAVSDGSYSKCNHTVCPSLNELKNTQHNYTDETIQLHGMTFVRKDKIKDYFGIEDENDVNNFKKPPTSIMMAFDRSCNLKCPSCRTDLLPNPEKDSDEYNILQNIMYDIETNLGSGLEKMLITGSGDPVYSKIYRDFLINFDKAKYPKLHSIHLITNGVLLDEKMWNSFKAKSLIHVMEISLDAGNKETYENTVRLNGDWDKLLSNIEYLLKQKDVAHFYFSMVVSEYNYKEMEQMYNLIMDMVKNVGVDKYQKVNLMYRQILFTNAKYTIQDINNISVFDKSHPKFEDFKKELMKVHHRPNVTHNFSHLLSK
jgi:sulfatase maturation enzyme AslB (radical SAM superfamily)